MQTNFLRSQFPSELAALQTVTADKRVSLMGVTQQRETSLSSSLRACSYEFDVRLNLLYWSEHGLRGLLINLQSSVQKPLPRTLCQGS